MKIVINKCHGGFGLSREAEVMWHELQGLKVPEYKEVCGSFYSSTNPERDCKFLVRVVEELGSGADGLCARLGIVEIPDDVKWKIEEYDGAEWVAEQHRTWE